MGARPMRIIFKPYGLKGVDTASEGQAYWYARTDFPASKNGKAIFGKGIDRESALADLCSWLPWKFRSKVQGKTEDDMFLCPDQEVLVWWQLNLDGSKLEGDAWLYEHVFWQRFGHLPFY